MPDVPLDLYQLVFRFELQKLTSPADIAEFSLWMAGVDGAEYGDPQLHSAAIGACHAWQDNVNQDHFTDAVVFSTVTARNFLANGHTNHEQVFVADGSWVGTSPGASMPWETSLCCSLYTYPRGTFIPQARRRRGRFYLPPMGADQLDGSNSGFFLNSALAGLLSELHAFVSAAQQDMVGVQVGDLVVYSRTGGDSNNVTQLSIDAKFDSQRRRQNREPVGYITLDM